MSSRSVWPYIFTLRMIQLTEAARHQKGKEVISKFFPVVKEAGIPVSLRWVTKPELGFPREPFQVFRRPRSVPANLIEHFLAAAQPVPPAAAEFQVDGNDLQYLVAFAAAPAGSLVVTAIDLYGKPLPNCTRTLTVAGTSFFACPGIASIRVSGAGTFGPLVGVSENAYANLPDWTMVQVVGLPFKDAEEGAFYNTLKQGVVPPTMDGVTAATQRLFFQDAVQLDPPPTGVPDFPLPPWPVPDPQAYIANLRSSQALVPMIGRCLTHSDDAVISNTQSLYTELVSLDGVKQADLPGSKADPARPSKAKLPIVGLTMLAVGTDSIAATGLGYGTIDLPPLVGAATPATGIATMAVIVNPGAVFGTGWDYMVTVPYTLPWGTHFVAAALSQPALPAEPPVALGAIVKQVHAPLARDTTAPAAVKLHWAPPSQPQAGGLLVSRNPNTSAVLNTPRPPAVKGYEGYLGLAPTAPDPTLSPEDLVPNFTDTAALLPVDGSHVTRYLAAGLDVFGLWSDWRAASVTLNAKPVQRPGLRDMQWIMHPDLASGPNGHIVPSDLQIDFVWDWQDRSPHSIRFTGQFIPAKTPLTAPFPGKFPLTSGNTMGNPIVVEFHYGAANPATVDRRTIVPVLVSGPPGSVALLSETPPDPNSHLVQYRLVVSGIMLDFSVANDLFCAVYADATESLRPAIFSVIQNPGEKPNGRVVAAADPLPPVVHFTPPAISWTALPDATGRARGLLQWTPDPKAAGYIVWEGTESALLHQLGAPDPDPAASLVARGGTLKTLLASNFEVSLQGFSRLNEKPIPGAQAEIDLPGSATTLYAFRVSAVTAKNVEASRSTAVAVFGVPQRMVPGQPRLLLRRPKLPQTGIQVIALPVETGVLPDGYIVRRVRNAALAGEAGLMGPPKITANAAGWTPFDSTPLRGGTTSHGKAILDTAATPSWYPYYYRVSALGPDDPANGRYRGESLPSLVQAEYALPSGPPMLQAAPLKVVFNTLFEFVITTDLPWKPSPIGRALIELVEYVADPADATRLIATTRLQTTPDAIPLGDWTGTPPPLWPPTPLLQGLGRMAPDASEHWQLYMTFHLLPGTLSTYLLRFTDPLGRVSEFSF
jgi:hypothetical protein